MVYSLPNTVTSDTIKDTTVRITPTKNFKNSTFSPIDTNIFNNNTTQHDIYQSTCPQSTFSSNTMQLHPFRIKYRVKDNAVTTTDATAPVTTTNNNTYENMKTHTTDDAVEQNTNETINNINKKLTNEIEQTIKNININTRKDKTQNNIDTILFQIKKITHNYLQNYINHNIDSTILPNHTEELIQYTQNLQLSLDYIIRQEFDTLVSIEVLDIEKSLSNTNIQNDILSNSKITNRYDPTPISDTNLLQNIYYTSNNELNTTLYVDPKKRYRGGNDTLQYQKLLSIGQQYTKDKNVNTIIRNDTVLKDTLSQHAINISNTTINSCTHNSNISIIKNIYSSDKIDENTIVNDVAYTLGLPPSNIGQSSIDTFNSTASNSSTLKNSHINNSNIKQNNEQLNNGTTKIKLHKSIDINNTHTTTTNNIYNNTDTPTALSIQKSDTLNKQILYDNIMTVPPATLSIVADMMQKNYLTGSFSNQPIYSSNKSYDKKSIQNDVGITKQKSQNTNDTILRPEIYFTNPSSSSSFELSQSSYIAQQIIKDKNTIIPNITNKCSISQTSPLNLGILNKKYCNTMLMNNASIFSTNTPTNEQNYQDITQNISLDILKTLPMLHYKTNHKYHHHHHHHHNQPQQQQLQQPQQQYMTKFSLTPSSAENKNFIRELPEYSGIKKKNFIPNHQTTTVINTKYTTIQPPINDETIQNSNIIPQLINNTDCTTTASVELKQNLQSVGDTSYKKVLDAFQSVKKNLILDTKTLSLTEDISNTQVISADRKNSSTDDNTNISKDIEETNEFGTINTFKVKKNKEIYDTISSRRTRITQEVC